MLVAWAMLIFFGSSEMGAMFQLTAAGGFVFFIGWLLARKNPEKR
jgi:hypothetical protein